MTQTLTELRQQYDDLCETRLREMNLPEECKTLKTMTFVAIERELLHMCAEEKFKAGIVNEKPGRAYGRTYGPRKNGSWQRRVCA